MTLTCEPVSSLNFTGFALTFMFVNTWSGISCCQYLPPFPQRTCFPDQWVSFHSKHLMLLALSFLLLSYTL